MSRKTKHPSDKAADSRIIAEETTTLPEGAVISVYLKRVGKLGHSSMKLVALHADKRVEMSVDKISPQNMHQYLQLVRRDIERRRKLLAAKPAMDRTAPNTMDEFVLSMAYHGMFIFEALVDDNYNQETGHTTSGPINADQPTTTKKVVSRSRKAKTLPQVQSDNNGTVHGSGTAKANRGRTKQ